MTGTKRFNVVSVVYSLASLIPFFNISTKKIIQPMCNKTKNLHNFSLNST